MKANVAYAAPSNRRDCAAPDDWRGPIAILRVWCQRARGRRALADLDERLLRDIGVTRNQALREARKPVWQA